MITETGLVEKAIAGIGPLDKAAQAAASARQDILTKPKGSLGKLEELAIRIAAMKGQAMPVLNRKAILIMASDHGVAGEGVSAYPQEVTAQMVTNFLRGGAGISVLSRQVGARITVVDIGVASFLEPHPGLLSRKIAFGSRNMACGPAMTREEAIRSIEIGLETIRAEAAQGLDIVGLGDMGIGNTTASSAITAVITGEPVHSVTGRGTGLDSGQLAHKIRTIEKALAVNRPNAGDPVDVLAKVGGFEIGGLAGVILGSAALRIPVVLDGFISGAAALIASELSAGVRDYLIASHLSVEMGHRAVLKHLGLSPLLDLDLRLGEGTGAALGIFLAEAATRLLTQMASFGEAGVSRRDDGEA